MPFFVFLIICSHLSCKNQEKKEEMKYINIVSKTAVSMNFILPPDVLQSEKSKSLTEWFEGISTLSDSFSSKTICVFKIYRTPDYNYAIYLALAKHSEDSDNQFEYLNTVGNSYNIPNADSKKINPEEIIGTICTEFQHFSTKNKQAASVFEKAELVTLTFDDYHFTKLLPK